MTRLLFLVTDRALKESKVTRPDRGPHTNGAAFDTRTPRTVQRQAHDQPALFPRSGHGQGIHRGATGIDWKRSAHFQALADRITEIASAMAGTWSFAHGIDSFSRSRGSQRAFRDKIVEP